MSGCTFPGPPAVIFLAPWEPVATLAVHGATPLPQGKGQGTPTPGDAMWKVIASPECPGLCLWLHCRSPAVQVHGTCLSVCWSWCFREPSVCSGKHALRRDLGLNVAVTDPQSQLGTSWASACAADPFRPRGAALGRRCPPGTDRNAARPLVKVLLRCDLMFSLVNLSKSMVRTHCQVGI